MKRAPAELITDPRLEAAGAWCLRLADGALSPADQLRFQAWLDDDPENRRAFEDAVGLWRAVGEASLTPELLALRRDALQGFESAHRALWSQPRSRRRRPMRWAPAAVAASLVLAVVGGWAVKTLLLPADYRTEVGERRVVVLTDGSKLSLDAATEVKVRYSGGARRLWLERGRAKFEVAKDAARPFTVAAADKVVRATGTAFSVELVQGRVVVVLYEGHVAVMDENQDGVSSPVRLLQPVRVQGSAAPGALAAAPGALIEADEVLTPGHELIAPVRAANAQVVAVDPVKSLAWEGGQLVFTQEPLSSAIERVSRYTDQKLSIGDARAETVRIDGVFTAGDTDAFVEGVTEVFPVRVRDTANGKVFVSRP